MNLDTAGLMALAEAERWWRHDIYDPPHSDRTDRADRSRRAIEALLRICGWTWEIPYSGDGQVQWCGIFVGACWVSAGITLDVVRSFFSSTYRLDLWARYRDFNGRANPKPTNGPYRLIANLDQQSKSLPFEPQAGDIVMVGDGVPACGDHIEIVESFDPGGKLFHTIGGNAYGLGPDGKRRQGVVRATRPLGGEPYCARRLLRPAPHDI